MHKLLWLLLLLPFFGLSQSNVDLRGDSIRIYKVGGSAELVLRNKTKDSLGVLSNIGNGVTAFLRPKLVGNTLIIGRDTFSLAIIPPPNNGQLTTWNVVTGAVDFGGDATTDISGDLHGHVFGLDSCGQCFIQANNTNGISNFIVSDTIASMYTQNIDASIISLIQVTPNGIQLFPQGTTGASPGYVWTLDDPTTGAGTWELNGGGALPNTDNLDSILSRGDTAHSKNFILEDGSGNVRVSFNPSINSYSIGSSAFSIALSGADSTFTISAYKGLRLQLNGFGANNLLFTQASQTIADTMAWPNTGNKRDTLATKFDLRNIAGGGTVTSIATTQGILGGTITSTGTLKSDTTYLIRYNDTTGSGTNNIATRTFVLSQGFITSSTNIYNTDGSLTANRTLTLNSHTLSLLGTATTSTFDAVGRLNLITSSGSEANSLRITNTVSGGTDSAIILTGDVMTIAYYIGHPNTGGGFAGTSYSDSAGNLLGAVGYDYPNSKKIYLADMRGVTTGASIEQNGSVFAWFDRSTLSFEAGIQGFATPHNPLHNNVAINSYGSLYSRDSLFVGNVPTGTSSDAIVEYRSSDSAFFKVSTISLTSQVSGVLPVANGGTNNATWTAGQMVYATSTTAFAGITAPAHSGMKLTSTGVNSFAWEDTTAGGGGGSVASPTTSIQFNNAGSFGGSASNVWDNTNLIQTITTPTTANTYYPSFIAQNTATASTGNQMYGGFFYSIGRGWKTTATAASYTNGYRWGTFPNQAALPSSIYVLQASLEGTQYENVLSIETDSTANGKAVTAIFGARANTGEGTHVTIGAFASSNSNGITVSDNTTAQAASAIFSYNTASGEARIGGVNGGGGDYTTFYSQNVEVFRASTTNHNLLIGSTTDHSGSKLQVTGIVYNSGMLTATGTPTVVMHNADSTYSQLTLATLATKIPTATGVVASADLTGQTATVSSVATVTPTANGTFRIGAYATITAISAGTLTITVTYTDETSTSRTVTFFPMGLSSAGLTATGATAFSPADIRAKSGSAITVVSTFSGVSITYDIGATITQLR